MSSINASTLSGTSKSTSDNKELINGPEYLVSEPENIVTDFFDAHRDEPVKRRIDRMMFHSALGKRELREDEEDLRKRGKIDTVGFSGILGKRSGYDRYGFVGSLGKRRGFDRYGFIGNLGKRRSYDRFGLIGSLGKRVGMDRYSFVGALGKRGRIDTFGFAGMLGKRLFSSKRNDLNFGKRAKVDRYSFFGNLGKRMPYSGDLEKQVDKHSVDNQQPAKPTSRRKRATVYPWYLDRKQRYYPSKWLRGIDRFSFGTRLGKRAPNYRFFPQLGKRGDWTANNFGKVYILFSTVN